MSRSASPGRLARARLETEGNEDVTRVDRRVAPVGEQLVGPDGGRAVHGTGHGQHRAAALSGRLHRVHRSAAGVGLHDDERLAQSGDEPVAGGKAPAVRARSQGRLRQEHPSLRHGLPELGVTWRIDHVQARGDDADGRAGAGSARPVVGGPVDAVGETGDDRHPGGGEVVAELGRHLPPVMGAAPGPDDRHTRALQRLELSQGEQHGRRLGVLGQGVGIAGLSSQVNADAQRRVRRPQPRDIDTRRRLAPDLPHRVAARAPPAGGGHRLVRHRPAGQHRAPDVVWLAAVEQGG